jgi:hypothetical protein
MAREKHMPARSEKPSLGSTVATQESAGELRPVNIFCTRGLADWLLRNNVSLAFTSYQTGRLYLVGVDDQRRVAFQERFLARAMGLWADQQRLLIATIFQVWRSENILPVPNTGSGPDRHYVPPSRIRPATSTFTR